MEKEIPNQHQVVIRPYNPKRFKVGEGLVGEIIVSRVNLENKFGDLAFLDDYKATPSVVTRKLFDDYREVFGDSSGKNPNIFFHLVQKYNPEKLAPKVQIFRSDVVLGNLNRDGFYRTVIEGKGMDYKKSKKYISEILRLQAGGVLDVRGIYSGYIVNLEK